MLSNKDIDNLEKKYKKELKVSQSPNLSEEEYEVIITYYLDLGEFSNAIKAAEAALIRYPSNSDLNLILADCFIQNQKFTQAEKLLTTSQHIYKNNYLYYTTLSSLYYSQNNSNKAIEVLKSGLDADIEDKEEICYELSEILYENGQPEQSLYYLFQSFEYLEGDEEVHSKILQLSIEIGLYRLAISFFEHRLDINSFDTQAWHSLFLIYDYIEDTENAENALEYLIAIEPNNPIYVTDFVQFHNQKGNFKKSLEQIDLAVKIQDTADLKLLKADTLFVSGHLSEAIELANEVLKISPQSAEAMYILASICYLKNQLMAATNWINKAIEIEYQSRFLILYSKILIAEKNYKEALELLEMNLEYQDELAEEFVKQIIILYVLEEEMNSAIKIAEDAVENELPVFNYYLCWLHWISHQKELAEEYLRTGLEEEFLGQQILFELVEKSDKNFFNMFYEILNEYKE